MEQLATKTYTLWESEAKQVREKMRKLQDKLAFLDENDYCIACFYGEAEELMKLENTYSYYYRNRLIEEEMVW